MLLEEYNKAENEGTLKPSYINRKITIFKCDCCNQDAVKPTSEHTRNINSGKKNFCCQSCAASYNNSIKNYTMSDSNKDKIKSLAGSRRDEFTPFRYTLRYVKRRFNKECNIELQDLKDLWEHQKGICPYTGLSLVLPENAKIEDITIRASLDRIDSSKGYIKGNIQFISTPINYMKSTMSDSKTKQFLKQISSFTSTFVED